MGFILTTILSPIGRYAMMALAVVLAILGFYATAKRSGRVAERQKQMERSYVISRKQAKIAARIRNTSDTVDRLRGHSF